MVSIVSRMQTITFIYLELIMIHEVEFSVTII